MARLKFSEKLSELATREDQEREALVSIACSLEIIAEVLEAWSLPPMQVVVKTEEQPVWPGDPA